VPSFADVVSVVGAELAVERVVIATESHDQARPHPISPERS
jgi:D-ribose pyranose/furanose isomerase RbsD